MKRTFLIVTLAVLCLAIVVLSLHRRAAATTQSDGCRPEYISPDSGLIRFPFKQGDSAGQEQARKACRECNGGGECKLEPRVCSDPALEPDCITPAERAKREAERIKRERQNACHKTCGEKALSCMDACDNKYGKGTVDGLRCYESCSADEDRCSNRCN